MLRNDTLRDIIYTHSFWNKLQDILEYFSELNVKWVKDGIDASIFTFSVHLKNIDDTL